MNLIDSLNINYSIVKFSGIPFAAPPVKRLRFQRPTLHVLSKDLRALEEPTPCPQLTVEGEYFGDEDCLQLNIYMPEVNENKRMMPVLIWFHGESNDRNPNGQFQALSSGSAGDIDPNALLSKEILVVTPQYRLGSLGFLNTVNEDLNGNMGLFDQLLALEWVQRYIGSFGGDAKQITIMGQGSSAISLGLLSTSELARGLFHRMILMGGSALSPMALDPNPKLTFAEIASENSCPTFPSLEFVRCMQERSSKSLVLSDHRLLKGKHYGKMRFPLPIIQKEEDRRFLPPLISKDPSMILSTGDYEAVPLIIGVSLYEMRGYLSSLTGKLNTDEINKTIFSNPIILQHFLRSVFTRNFVDPDIVSDIIGFEYFSGLNTTERQEQAKDVLEEMFSDLLYSIPALSMAKSWSKFGPVYFYVFDYSTTLNLKNQQDVLDPNGDEFQGDSSSSEEGIRLQSNHGSDVQFLMHGHKGSSKDRTVSSIFIELWTNFIHKGSPLNSGVDWPPFRDTKEFLMINEDMEIQSGFRKRQEQLWTQLLPSINARVCGSVSEGNKGSRRNGLNSSLIRKKKSPIIYTDVKTTDFSKRFFI